MLKLKRPQFIVNLWIFEEADDGQVRSCDSLLDLRLHASMPGYGLGWIPDFWEQDSGEHPQQLSSR